MPALRRGVLTEVNRDYLLYNRLFACFHALTSAEKRLLDARLGVLMEVNCETDFVARGETFKSLCDDLAMQVAAFGEVVAVSADDLDADLLAKERDIEMGKEDIQKAPEDRRWGPRSALKPHGPIPSVWRRAAGHTAQTNSQMISCHICCDDKLWALGPNGCHTCSARIEKKRFLLGTAVVYVQMLRPFS